MSRDVPFDKDLKCDNCGSIGAHDFMGDYFCGDCLRSCEKCEGVFVVDKKSGRTICWECSPKK